MEKYNFEAILIRPEGVGTWTYVDIPLDLRKLFDAKGQVKVKGTINSYPFRSTALPHGDGMHYLVVKKPIRDSIQFQEGGKVEVVLELDTDARQVDVPDDLESAFINNPKARAAYDRMAYSHQKEYVDWILQAKRAETRQKRIKEAVQGLSDSANTKSSG